MCVESVRRILVVAAQHIPLAKTMRLETAGHLQDQPTPRRIKTRYFMRVSTSMNGGVK